ncbi:Uncharacterised protein [Mycobacteroides abscessus]|nr:Uncharacterised protein [Mycobacteroides abscessus]
MLLTLLLSFDGSRTTQPDAAVPGRGRDDRPVALLLEEGRTRGRFVTSRLLG